MGNNKKKRNRPDLEELLGRPWCYYCERDFDDLKILIDHQRAKHFKCDRCGRRLNTAGGLSVHLNQVHKETLTTIDNALPNRSNLDVEIFGTEGIPADVVEQHRQRVVTQFAQAEAERRAATGNPPPGNTGSGETASKKVKVESKDDIKKRMAEFKARKAAEAQAKQTASNSAAPEQQNAQQMAPHQHIQGITNSPSPGGFGSIQPYGNAFPPPGQTFSPSQQASAFSPPGNGAYGAPPGFVAGAASSGYGPGQFAPGSVPNTYQDGGQRMYGAGSPPMPFGQQGQFQPPPIQSQLPGGTSIPVSAHGGYSSPPGLPQRPAFGAPPVNAATMQQMHQGQITSQSAAHNAQINGATLSSNGATPTIQAPAANTKASTPVPASSKPESDSLPSKKSKKDEKSIRMVYSDSETSPEEKMAVMQRYAFVRDDKPEEVTEQMDIEKIGALNSALGDGE